MKTIRFAAALRHLLWGIVLGSSVAGFQTATAAVQMKQARVTFVVNDVKLLLPQGAPRPAAVNDNVRGGVALQTGTNSRSELTFPDLTITRLGANTIFSFNEEARTLDLSSGAILVQVPKHSRGVQIQTAGVTAAITGTTVMMEYHPGGFIKAIAIEGTFRMYLKKRVGESVLVHAGEMLIVKPNATRLPDPVHVDLKELLKTSLLITGFGPLPSVDLMAQAVQTQIAEEASGQLIQTNLVIFGSGTLVSLLDPTNTNTVSQAAAARPAPTPTRSEFGPPTVIASPVPYLITSGTIITTDPAITTNGVTGYGTIYRGQTDDGAFTLWAFGSTSAFDNALGIDDGFFADPNHLPIATFKFQSLSLNGNPTIDPSNGVTKLALIGVDAITSGPPGGVLTFTGLDLLVLATVNGSINLTSDVSFQDLSELAMYARGAGSNLILNSPISNIGILDLAAEGSIHLTNPGAMSIGEFDATAGNNLTLQIGGSLLLNGSVVLQTLVLPGTTVANGANLTLNITGDYMNSSATESSALSVINQGAHTGTGGNILVDVGLVDVGGNLTTAGDFDLTVQNTTGQIDNGGNVTLTVGGSLATLNGGSINTLIDNSNGGTIGAGGNISVTTGGDLTTSGQARFTIQNTTGTINNGGNLTLAVSGSLAAQALALLVENWDGTANPAGNIGTGGNISVTTGRQLNAGSINTLVDNRNGGTIDSSANLTFNIGGPLTTQGDATFLISNRNDGSGGGTIGGDVNLTLSATSISAGGIFVTDVSANRGGHIMGSAHNSVDAAGLLSAGTSDFEIENAGFDDGGGFAPGGTIVSDAILSVTASGISTSGDYFNEIIWNAGGGHIGGNATVSVLASSMDVATDAYFNILNSQNGAGTPAGSIGGNAAIQVNLGNMLVGGFIDAEIDNSGGGSIGGSANVNFTLTGDLTTQGDGNFFIFNNPGTIGSNATIDVTAGSISTGGSLFGLIDNTGGNIGGNALINFSTSGDITSQGEATFQILNSGGSIGGDVEINLNAANITANSLLAQIDNTSGTINSSAAINMNVSGSATIATDADFEILGSDGAAAAAINFNGGSYDAGGTFLAYMDGNGTITFNNVNAHADVLKAGVFGASGVLNIGGGTLSADSILKLYAPGSNGQLNFMSNVTLGGNSLIKVLAANSVTIFNNVVVTIGGSNPADVYTNNANYTGYGGNNTTTGTFAGAGANNPQPLSNAPPFGPSSPAPSRRAIRVGINISNTDELLSLFDAVTPGRGGRIRIPASERGKHGRNSSRVNAAAYLNPHRRALDTRTASTPAMRRLPQ